MLIPNFYTITDLRQDENRITARIELNVQHPVYEGHFPGQAVVPGVIQLQIVKEILEKAEQRKFTYKSVYSAKYLHVIDPEVNSRLEALILIKNSDADGCKIEASVSGGQLTFLKLKAVVETP